MTAEQRERIERELSRLRECGQDVQITEEGRDCVLYRRVPTRGEELGLPAEADVLVPVPPGYPGGAIDLAGLPVSSTTSNCSRNCTLGS